MSSMDGGRARRATGSATRTVPMRHPGTDARKTSLTIVTTTGRSERHEVEGHSPVLLEAQGLAASPDATGRIVATILGTRQVRRSAFGTVFRLAVAAGPQTAFGFAGTSPAATGLATVNLRTLAEERPRAPLPCCPSRLAVRSGDGEVPIGSDDEALGSLAALSRPRGNSSGRCSSRIPSAPTARGRSRCSSTARARSL